ncbi:MAG TPA: aminopeptidase [Casimicrobiaceae bacterium]|nr:aminopeptidase [Casimicrobiaceae bacterium]
MRSRGRALLAALVGATLAGCSAIDFYWQGLHGQYEILAGARPIAEAIGDASDPRVKARLELAERIRDFATHALALPANDSYRRYTDLGRPYVLYNVFATPALSLAPRAWCYPIAGCVNYRGYFDEADARAEAARLKAAGDDIYIGGVPAYSTLGWFDDPILSTFVRYPETEFARLIFHELAHQLIYVKGDTLFNESYATAVSDEGLERWIAAQPADMRARLDADRLRSERLRGEFRRIIGDARMKLETLYASGEPAMEKASAKRAIFAAMRADYDRVRAGEPGLAGFDRWFAGDDGKGPNNASLAAIALYTTWVPAFRRMIADAHGDLPRFYDHVRALAMLPKPQRDAALDALAGATPTRDGGAD